MLLKCGSRASGLLEDWKLSLANRETKTDDSEAEMATKEDALRERCVDGRDSHRQWPELCLFFRETVLSDDTRHHQHEVLKFEEEAKAERAQMNGHEKDNQQAWEQLDAESNHHKEAYASAVSHFCHFLMSRACRVADLERREQEFQNAPTEAEIEQEAYKKHREICYEETYINGSLQAAAREKAELLKQSEALNKKEEEMGSQMQA